MTGINDIKQKIGENTEKLEKKVKDFWDQASPNYSNLEPWKRGLILLGILGGTIAIIYLLTGNSKGNKGKEQIEAQAEERLIKKMELLNRLKQ